MSVHYFVESEMHLLLVLVVYVVVSNSLLGYYHAGELQC